MTHREFEVLAAYAHCGTVKEAAFSLGISYETTKRHLANVYLLLDVTTFVDAVRALGWLVVPEDPNPHEAQ